MLGVNVGYSVELSQIGALVIFLAVILLGIRYYGRKWSSTSSDIAILLVATAFGYVLFNPTIVISYLYPSPVSQLAPFVSLALGLMLGILILLIIRRVSPHSPSPRQDFR